MITDEYNINVQHREIVRLLDNKQLKDALKEIETLITETPEWELRSKLDDIQTSYQYMLKYMQQGIVDLERTKLYHQLLSKTYQLNDQLRIVRLTPVSTEYYFERRRYYKLIPHRPLPALQMELESYAEEMAIQKLMSNKENELVQLRKRHENALIELFNLIWTSDAWTDADEEAAQKFLSSLSLQAYDLSLFISALTMSLMENFDLRKFMLLLDAYQHSSNQVNQRALVGIALLIFTYDNRLYIYPEIKARLELLNESKDLAQNFSRIQLQLLRSRETKKIDKKMREEIIPEMIKKVNRMNRKLDIDEAEEESYSEDKNPDWNDWIEKSRLNDKLKEMSELQMEGADVYMSTFSQLKTFPFFREMANWFYPFDPQHSAVVQIFGNTPDLEKNSLLKNILQSGFFCNSDKYSFCFTIMQIPESQRAMMTQQFEEQNNALSEANPSDKLTEFSQRPETISNQYIQDLYRFFKVFPRRHEFTDIFEESLNLQYTKTLKGFLGDITNKRNLADYFFHKNYLLEAYLLYEEIAKETGGDAEIFQKMGYCLQKSKNYEKAIEAYMQADLLRADNVWTNRHLAICYRQLKQYDKALEYYRKVEAVQPENLTILTQIGHCLAELKRCEEALTYFFKVEYLNPESPKAWRAIAWCSFLTGKYEQAMKYYEKLMNKETQLHDYLNAGHVAWVSGEMGKAVKLYATSLAMSSNREEFINLFKKDEEELLAQGIKEEDIPLMLDLLKYNMD